MSCHPRVTAWTTVRQPHWPHVSQPPATVWARWSLGLGLARAWALPAVSVCLATWVGRKAPPGRPPWRECCDEASAPRGPTRCALAVAPCVVPLRGWGVEPWEGPPLAVALAATPVGARLTVWALSGV